LARQHGLRYTRYADDLVFSAKKPHDLASLEAFKSLILRELSSAGFSANRRKTVIRGPGTRRIVLGVLVDGPLPRLAREYKDRIRQHLYYLTSAKHRPSEHAKQRHISVTTLYHHLRGMIAWAERVEPIYGAISLAAFNEVQWPPVDYRWPDGATDEDDDW